MHARVGGEPRHPAPSDHPCGGTQERLKPKYGANFHSAIAFAKSFGQSENMPTIKSYGGAERYWRDRHGDRLVLCRNGKVMLRRANGARWLAVPDEFPLVKEEWQDDTRPVMRAAVTKTTRQARRK